MILLPPPQISDPWVRFWDADFGPPEGGSLIWTVPAMQNKGKWLEKEGVTYYDACFGPFPWGQLCGHGYASGRGSLIRGDSIPITVPFLDQRYPEAVDYIGVLYTTIVPGGW